MKYIKGDATAPVGDPLTNKIIAHCCNDGGGWGRGFVLALNKKFYRPEIEYRKWAKDGRYWADIDNRYTPLDDNDLDGEMEPNDFKLGQIQVVGVDAYLFVCNMIGQSHWYPIQLKIREKIVSLNPIRYGAIEECLMRLAQKAIQIDASVHCPRFGAGLAGASWARIEDIIERVLCDNGIDVTVYDFENSSYNP